MMSLCLYCRSVVDVQVNWVGAVANEMLFPVTGRCLWKLMLLIRDTAPWRVVRGRMDREGDFCMHRWQLCHRIVVERKEIEV